MAANDRPGPLAGVRVLDLSRLVAGGALGMQLADFGADVVKVEQPGRGDPLRTWTVGGESWWWRVYGRNKRSNTLNLDHAEGRALLQRLIPRFDILVESFVPGKLERWGLGPEQLHVWHPGLIIVRISGWGQTGPHRAQPGFGTLVKAASGLVAMTGSPDHPPVLPPFPMADMYAALYAANAVVMALYHRDRSGADGIGGAGGGGQVIDVALFDAFFSVLGPLAAEYAATGQPRTRAGGGRSRNSAPRGVYATADGGFLTVSASTPDTAERFLRAYGLGDLLADPRFATNEARVANAEALEAHVIAAIARYTLDEHRRIIAEHRLTAVPIQTIADIERDPHWQARELTMDVADEAGPVRMHHPVPRLDVTPGAVRQPGPALGADNAAIYGDELGLAPEVVERFRQDGIV